METLNHTLYNLDIFKGEQFCRAACWFDILTQADNEAKTVFWKDRAIDLRRGEFATTVRQLTERWNMSVVKVRMRLKEFVRFKLIKVLHSANAIIISVCAICMDTQQPESELSDATITDEVTNDFDEISCNKDFRQEMKQDHNVSNWTNYRRCFLKYLLSHRDVAQQWHIATYNDKLKLLREHFDEYQNQSLHSTVKELTRSAQTSNGKYVKQDDKYVLLPPEAPDFPSCEHYWDTTRHKWLLHPAEKH